MTTHVSQLSPIALLALLALNLQPPASAQEGQDHKRPERGDVVPELTLVDAATGKAISLHAELAAPGQVPLVLAFLHHDKDLCGRFLQELAVQARSLGDALDRCAILLVFSGDTREGPAIEAAKQLGAPFRRCWDADRSAYQTMGMIAFPTVYVLDRGTRTIDVVRRGYKLTLAQEVVARLKVGLGLMTAAEFARLDAPADEVPAAVKQRQALLRQAQQLLRGGKPEAALPLFEQVLTEQPDDPAARAGRAIAASRLGRAEAHDLLAAAHAEQPEDSGVALALATWLMAHDRLDEAETMIRSAIEHDPAPSYYALGRLHEQRGNWKEAAIAYREAASRLLR